MNSIVLEVPISMLTVDGHMHAAGDKNAVIGTYGTTSRQKVTVLRDDQNAVQSGPWAQVQREGNPLINELIIGTGSKDRFSMDDPANDSQFGSFFLNPLLAQIFAGIGIPVPPAPAYRPVAAGPSTTLPSARDAARRMPALSQTCCA